MQQGGSIVHSLYLYRITIYCLKRIHRRVWAELIAALRSGESLDPYCRIDYFRDVVYLQVSPTVVKCVLSPG